MTSCKSCHAYIEEHASFCERCEKIRFKADSLDENSSPLVLSPTSATHLNTLCIVTLVGSCIGVIRGYIYQSVSESEHFGNPEYIRGWIFIITNIGTIFGTLFLLSKKQVGLYIYTLFQLSYLVTVLWAMMTYMTGTFTDQLTLMISSLFFLPSLALFILFWTKTIRANFQ